MTLPQAQDRKRPQVKKFSLREDIDPEDQYNNLENSSKKPEELKDRKHYGGLKNLGILEEAFESVSGGKYRGEKVMRKDLQFQDSGSRDASAGSFESEYESDSSSGEQENTPNEKDPVDELALLKMEMEALQRDQEATINVISKQRVSDKLRGEHVKNQLKAWEMMLDLEMKVHKVLEISGVLMSARKSTKRLFSSVGRELQRLSELEGLSETHLNSQGRVNLTRWHLETVHTHKTTFNRDPWTMVDDAWRSDRQRLLSRSFPNGVYSDADFHRFLLKEWAGARAIDGVAFRSVKTNHKPTDNKQSKGRRLAYDPHPKLASYMMPSGDAGWSGEKSDELYAFLLK